MFTETHIGLNDKCQLHLSNFNNIMNWSTTFSESIPLQILKISVQWFRYLYHVTDSPTWPPHTAFFIVCKECLKTNKYASFGENSQATTSRETSSWNLNCQRENMGTSYSLQHREHDPEQFFFHRWTVAT